MSRVEAQQVLERYRPGMIPTPDDPELSAALECARTDEELGVWFREHCQFQVRMLQSFRAITAPAGLKSRLLSKQSAVPLPAVRRAPLGWLALAASILVIAGLAGFWLSRDRLPDQFADYRARMVRSVLREYRLQVRSADLQAVRKYMTVRGAPDDFIIPGGLAKLPLVGGGFLRWRNQPVAMICFRQGNEEMAYLFVLDRAGSREAPPAEPEIVIVSGRSSAAWTSGNRIYLMMGGEKVDARTLL